MEGIVSESSSPLALRSSHLPRRKTPRSVLFLVLAIRHRLCFFLLLNPIAAVVVCRLRCWSRSASRGLTSWSSTRFRAFLIIYHCLFVFDLRYLRRHRVEEQSCLCCCCCCLFFGSLFSCMLPPVTSAQRVPIYIRSQGSQPCSSRDDERRTSEHAGGMPERSLVGWKSILHRLTGILLATMRIVSL